MRILEDITVIENVKYHRPVWYNEVSKNRVPFKLEHPSGEVAGYFDEIGTLYIFDVEDVQGIRTTYTFAPKSSSFVEEPCPDTFYEEGFLGSYLRKCGL